jgi:hypothetical protein
MKSHRSLALVMALAAGCAQPPDRVFVPGSSFTHVVEVRTAQGAEAEVKVGEWLTLHARRQTGPWTETDRTSLGPNGCWVGGTPPTQEPEVADNLHWRTDPTGGELNLGINPDHVRQVRFSAPGRYVMRATSTTWCSANAESNALVIVVRP